MKPGVRRHRARQLKLGTTIACLAGLAILSAVAAANSKVSRGHRVSPNAELSRVQSELGYPFWDTSSGKVAAPTWVNTPPQTTSGGS